jgi:dienelactone hydrolase
MWQNWSRSKRWLVSFGVVFLLVVAAGTAGLLYFLRVPDVPLPPGVKHRTEEFTLAGKVVAVDFYLPPEGGPAPVVMVAHGFTRNRRTMAGWGGRLAAGGFLAVVLGLPTWADHARNGRAIAELMVKVMAGELSWLPKPSGRAALVGFSAGGLSTLLAASGNTNVGCWVGLDPVAAGRAAMQAAESLRIPAFALRAEPAPWNAHGNIREVFAALPGPAFSLVVKQATHVDAENPTSRAADWACGQSDPARREVFGRYLLTCLRAGSLGDVAAFRQLQSATNDATVRDVEYRKLERW